MLTLSRRKRDSGDEFICGFSKTLNDAAIGATLGKCLPSIATKAGQAQPLWSAIAIPQFEGSTSAIAILKLFKEMLLRNCNSATITFSVVRNSKDAIFGIILVFKGAKRTLKHIFGFIITNCVNNIFGIFS